MGADRPSNDERAEGLRSLAHVNLAQEAYGELKRGLMTGGFRPGAKLTIRDLASAMGISPTPVREALVQLAAEGALEQTAGRSFVVPQLDAESYEDLRLLRELTEGEAAFRAAGLATNKTIAELTRLHEHLIEAKNSADYRSALVWNQRFHLELAATGGSRRLLRIVEGLWLQMGPLLNVLYEHRDVPSLGERHSHLTVIEALHNRDGVAARAAIQADIAGSATAILGNLQAQDTTGGAKR